MRSTWLFAALFGFTVMLQDSSAVTKPHVVVLGKWTTVKWFADADDKQPVDLKVRSLLVDGRTRETTLGLAHDVTDRLFVVRRAFRLNDALPDEPAVPAHWRWERGGWLLVDRLTGRVSPIVLPEFDPYYSVASWYRDYAAYCGVSDDGGKVYAVVTQLGRRKPLLKKILDKTSAHEGDAADSPCTAPTWQRQPMRVSIGKADQKSTFAIRGRAVDLLVDEPDEEDAMK